MSGGVQITIPDLDDDDYGGSTSFGFGKQDNPFARALAGDSPTSTTTPLAAFGHSISGERTPFQSHSRNESIASQDSAQSIGVSTTTRYTALTHSTTSSRTAFHSSQSSITASSQSPFSIPKKSSFASIRNAFKSGVKGGGSFNNNDPPPVPPLSDAYPLFNRSTSSLNKINTTPFQRPSTPTSKSSKHRAAHSYARSHHSQNGSIFHISDGGSDQQHSNSPPPVPRMPVGMNFGQLGGGITEFEDTADKVVIDPKTPSDYALHAVFIRFATSAEERINMFLKESLDTDPPLQDFMGPDINTALDESLNSLGKIAQKHAKPVVDSIMRWRRSQYESVSSDILRLHTMHPPPLSLTLSRSRSQSQSHSHIIDIPAVLNERKSLASIYITCRALVIILKALDGIRDGLSDALGYSLEESAFEGFRKPVGFKSPNHRVCAEMYAILLGTLANVSNGAVGGGGRFVSVTDRMISELEGMVSAISKEGGGGKGDKEIEAKVENLVRGIRYVKIKVWPTERFVEGAEFMEMFAKAFVGAHGSKLKIVFVDTLMHLLHPIGKTAQVETNDPTWRKAIEFIHPRAVSMASKPRYWAIAFPLVVTSLCVAPQDFFLKNWWTCVEGCLAKLKEKSQRLIIMNGLLRLVWTYLYRCQESQSSTITRLEGLVKHFFPAGRASIGLGEECIPILGYLMHFILSRHWDFGRDTLLDLLQESSTSKEKDAGIPPPERTQIATQAFLLSLSLIEREELKPSWPSNLDFSLVPDPSDYPATPDFPPQSVFSKSTVKDLFERVGTALVTVTQTTSKTVGSLNVLDDQWTWSRSHMVYEEPHNYVTRRHDDGHAVAYPQALSPYISLLQTCFSSWPRLLHPSLTTEDAIDMLLRGVVHVEPAVSVAAVDALRRFMGDEEVAIATLQRAATFICKPKVVPGSGAKSLVNCSKLLNLWVELLDKWAQDFKKSSESDAQGNGEGGGSKMIQEIEACALFLLSHQKDSVRNAGVTAIRILGLLPSLSSNIAPADEDGADRSIVQRLHHEGLKWLVLEGLEEMLSNKESEYLIHYQTLNKPDILLRIADSHSDTDRALWKHLFPTFLQTVEPHLSSIVPNTMNIFRDAIVAMTTRYIPFISHIAGLSSRAPAGLPNRSHQGHDKDWSYRLLKENRPLMDQWYAWVKILCATSLPPEARPTVPGGREHSRAPSDSNAMFEKEKLTTTRGLFRYLTPFLDSEYEFFRDAAVCCVSSTPSTSYPQLLEDLGLLANRQFHEDPRLKSTSTDDLRMGRIAVERSRRHERLRVAVTRIYFLTAHHLSQQRSMGKQTALSHVLKFVRNAQIFLCTAEVRDNHTLQKLRRYFCGVVEQLFDGLASLNDSGRFIQPNMHLTLYRLCEEWCQHGSHRDGVKRRLISMQRAAAVSSEDDRSDAVEKFQKETLALSEAAVGALSSLCQKPLFTTEPSSISPTERFPADYTAALSASAVLERFCAILTSIKPNIRAKGQKALRFLLTAELDDRVLYNETLTHATVLEDQTDTSHSFCFEVVAEVICKQEPHGFTFAQILYLGLVNLCHVSPTIRQLAFNMLQAAHRSESVTSMSHFEASIRSSAPSVYSHAHSFISDFLSREHPQQAVFFLAQLNSSLPLLSQTSSSKDQVLLLLLQSLEFWITEIDLMDEDKTSISHQGIVALYHLMALTLRYGQSHAEQILALWSKLVEYHQSNALATVRFLVEQSHKVGSTVFIKCAANIVACLCHTIPGASVFEELCSIIEPAQMLPVIDHKLAFPDPEDMELWSNMDALFAEQPRLSLGAAQFAWLFLVEISVERAWDFRNQLPVLLHAIFTHFDNRVTFVRQQARHLLFQVLRSWIVGYEDDFSNADFPASHDCFRIVDDLESQGDSLFWKEEDSTSEVEKKMKGLCEQILSILGPLCPRLEDKWGSLALEWGTSCSIRSTAFRSLQIFRSIMSRPTKSDLALLLGRLSNTIAGTNSNIQSFTSEILLTLQALTVRDDLDATLLPQIFWCSCACLETPVEIEYEQTLQLLDALLGRINLNNEITGNSLISSRPFNWEGSDVLQPMLLKGLRSSKTSGLTWKILGTLSTITDDRLIDSSEGRLRDLYITALPSCLYVMANPDCEQATSMRALAEDIGYLAKQENRESIARIMASFSKGHFRTKDDFLRQSANSLREHYGGEYWREMTTLLLGLVLNNQKWLRIETMNVLKVLFQLHPSKQVKSELLMPLLRLLNTDLAHQALEVLEEPLGISGGPAAKHVLRMSMLHGAFNSPVEADVFGVPEESGWSVPKADTLREMCRANVMSVFDTCSLPSTRPSRIDFEPEMDFHQFTNGYEHESIPDGEEHDVGGGEEDIGGLVKRLHALTSYFQSPNEPKTPLPTQRLEARVAAILAKSSTSDRDIPQTPFLDIFRVGDDESSDDYEEDEDDTDEDEDDAFIFDSPSVFQTNGYGRG